MRSMFICTIPACASREGCDLSFQAERPVAEWSRESESFDCALCSSSVDGFSKPHSASLQGRVSKDMRSDKGEICTTLG